MTQQPFTSRRRQDERLESAFLSGCIAERARLAQLLATRLAAPASVLLQSCEHTELRPFLQTMETRLATVLSGLQQEMLTLPQAVQDWRSEFILACDAAAISAVCRLGAIDTGLHADGPVIAAVARMIRETTANIARHSCASVAQLSIRVDAGRLIAEICDDGDGRTESVRPGRGLCGIERRTLALGGEWTIENQPSRGLRFRLSVPLVAADIRNELALPAGRTGLPPAAFTH